MTRKTWIKSGKEIREMEKNSRMIGEIKTKIEENSQKTGRKEGKWEERGENCGRKRGNGKNRKKPISSKEEKRFS